MFTPDNRYAFIQDAPELSEYGKDKIYSFLRYDVGIGDPSWGNAYNGATTLHDILHNIIGFDPVTREGKFAKRVAKHINKAYDYKLSNTHISELGNRYNLYSVPAGSLHLTISRDLDIFTGQKNASLDHNSYGSVSCFAPGQCNHHHWLSMDNDDRFYCVRLFDNSENMVGRAWLQYRKYDSQLVLFNSYGISLKTLAHMLSVTLDVNIIGEYRANSDLWINGDKCIILGEGVHPYSSIAIDCDLDSVDMCYHCEDPIDSDEGYYSERTGHMYCEYCYSDLFSSCSQCETELHTDDCYNHNHEILCESCYNENFTYCHECGESIDNDDAYYNNDMDPFCYTCYNDKYLTCDSCDCSIDNDDDPSYEYEDEHYCTDCMTEHMLNKTENIVNNLYCDSILYDSEIMDATYIVKDSDQREYMVKVILYNPKYSHMVTWKLNIMHLMLPVNFADQQLESRPF